MAKARDAAENPPAPVELGAEEVLSALEAAVEVGRGGFGVVYAVELPSLPGWGRVAVKRALSEVDAREVMAEVSNLRRCAHRDVLPLLGYCGAPRAACIVTALMRGGSLDDHLLLSPDARARLQKRLQRHSGAVVVATTLGALRRGEGAGAPPLEQHSPPRREDGQHLARRRAAAAAYSGGREARLPRLPLRRRSRQGAGGRVDDHGDQCDQRLLLDWLRGPELPRLEPALGQDGRVRARHLAADGVDGRRAVQRPQERVRGRRLGYGRRQGGRRRRAAACGEAGGPLASGGDARAGQGCARPRLRAKRFVVVWGRLSDARGRRAAQGICGGRRRCVLGAAARPDQQRVFVHDGASRAAARAVRRRATAEGQQRGGEDQRACAAQRRAVAALRLRAHPAALVQCVQARARPVERGCAAE
ncbi:hypothetical protein EMIHUDRAFT_455348 [Emiliania huxleyi CCMP1516]|uniref:Serine-threonine/tyrosine-protein kinase catalytic domain-containing protein n=2 Tax=Emiliania huxleyi TaxID=2903 RepID=A0A0D3KHM6_EMIH1|nr:hypothetical protein EMIHUDRAFT_455348 [Emiliania huxleyi CCMP1516]EOD35261.1 hypothetical protein EMIHUDRAFT_455348 [Emiliania huxleyi CCMP1516]|eukprot:XP_005787690.1 hypothetical protein EMIHUDRAFT_455348 [Emiliania huxleyi CCMP1516]